ncbi:integrase core domain-containing protein [Desulfolutivibrio sp.]|uniref:integrase core domain-containing protein n=1 Tax=Desulfolutivibrio sp. TaxID=2773296 RepID=UPI003FA444CC
MEARKIFEEWRQDYNVLRPHSALGGLSPEEYRRASKGQKLKESRPNLSVVNTTE